VQVVQAHLRRIETYDDRGPTLNAIISKNPAALETAAELDRIRGAARFPSGPLHCIPIILKDNFDTADMATTGGSVTLARSIPLRDAFVVRKLRDAGAIILAKANLTELARGGTTVSSLGGQTRNPWRFRQATSAERTIEGAASRTCSAAT
jgi:Asp-tRNA(Asn)/Glu-tRNA(Gln) amidotransferase A subunit family amidase